MSYVIAWGGEINAQDIRGLTPLHFAVKMSKEFSSTKAIK
jgi:ankyrin repeat protein